MEGARRTGAGAGAGERFTDGADDGREGEGVLGRLLPPKLGPSVREPELDRLGGASLLDRLDLLLLPLEREGFEDLPLVLGASPRLGADVLGLSKSRPSLGARELPRLLMPFRPFVPRIAPLEKEPFLERFTGRASPPSNEEEPPERFAMRDPAEPEPLLPPRTALPVRGALPPLPNAAFEDLPSGRMNAVALGSCFP